MSARLKIAEPAPRQAPVYEHDLWTRPRRVTSPDDGLSDADDYSWPDRPRADGAVRGAVIGGAITVWLGCVVAAFGHFVAGWW